MRNQIIFKTKIFSKLQILLGKRTWFVKYFMHLFYLASRFLTNWVANEHVQSEKAILLNTFEEVVGFLYKGNFSDCEFEHELCIVQCGKGESGKTQKYAVNKKIHKFYPIITKLSQNKKFMSTL